MKTIPPKPRAVRAASGTCRWLRPLLLPLGVGRLAITNSAGATTEYDVGAHLDAAGRVVGLRLVKDDDEAYDVDTTGPAWTCDCPDGTFQPDRPGGCKHARALRAALAATGQLHHLARQVERAPAPRPAAAAGWDDL